MSEEQSAYDAILERCPPVTWVMPDDAPDHTALARRDEIMAQKFKSAARLYWLVRRATFHEGDLDPSDEWLAQRMTEIEIALRPGKQWLVSDEQWHIMRILGVTQSWLSSSARVEQD